MRKDGKKGNIPEVGDLWKDPKLGNIWLLMEISFDDRKNTDMTRCKNMSDCGITEQDFSYMYIKKMWEYMA
jgi:hypothetical protein